MPKRRHHRPPCPPCPPRQRFSSPPSSQSYCSFETASSAAGPPAPAFKDEPVPQMFDVPTASIPAKLSLFDNSRAASLFRGSAPAPAFTFGASSSAAGPSGSALTPVCQSSIVFGSSRPASNFLLPDVSADSAPALTYGATVEHFGVRRAESFGGSGPRRMMSLLDCTEVSTFFTLKMFQGSKFRNSFVTMDFQLLHR